ncbi:MAG: hypothetical protein IJH52_01585 [Oscillospiraceae bacterium]|nr:hypothetical protein [Oscillospiraceae bacterium]
MKKILSIVLCAVLLFSALGVQAFAVNAEEYAALPYQNYCYLGDSISWGYGLDPNMDNHNKFSIGTRVTGSFTDIIASVLEQNNNAVVHPAASSGSRLCDYRILLERGMGVENPYDRANDWYGNRHPERTEELRKSGEQVVNWVREADLITLQIGINDLTAAIVNALYATGLIDLDKIQQLSLSDPATLADYLTMALGNLQQSPDVLGNVIRTFNSEILEIRANAREVLKDIVTLAPEADVVIVGYHKAVQSLRIIPGTDFSAIFDIADAALVSLNDYYAALANEYSSVYYVDAPDAEIFYPEGTSLVDIVKDIKGFLKNAHPNHNGHVYIADRVLDALMSLNTVCRHEHTKNVCETKQLACGVELVSTEYCTDCGAVIHWGKVVTPYATYTTPSYTITNAVSTVFGNIHKVVGRIFNGLTMAYTK